ncbi:hypothetical protein ACFLTT_01335 [Chloroflexota bacterium]
MIIKCPECGENNTYINPPEPNKKYRCGKCKVIFTYQQTIDAPNLQTIDTPSKRNFSIKGIGKGIGQGTLIASGGTLLLVFNVLQFIFVASAGLGTVWGAITLFMDGSILWGLVVLFIGTPISIALAQWLFIPLFFISIIVAIIWGLANLFGFDVSFDSAWSFVWFIGTILIIGFMAFFGVTGFVEAIKSNRVLGYFKENWFYILIFCGLFWWFFLA